MPPPKDVQHFLRGPGDYEVTEHVHNDTYPGIDPRKVDLSGKAVFVTGGSRGLGKAMVLSFVRAGASQIAAGARSFPDGLAKEVEEAAAAYKRSKPDFFLVKMEITDEKSVADAATTIKEKFGKLDVLVNNAGLFGDIATIAESDPANWWKVLEVNVKGPYLVTRAFLPLLEQSKSAQKYIVNVVSVGAHLLNPGTSQYLVSKLALTRFSQLTNIENSEKGIHTIAVHPGNVLTDMTGGATGAAANEWSHIFVETPELSGDTIAWFTAGDRSWLGGRYVNCTWDMPELLAQRDDIVSGNKLIVKLDH